MKNVNTAQFSDNITLISSSYRIDAIMNVLKGQSKKSCKYLEKWGLHLSIDKTDATIFNKRRLVLPTNIMLNNNNV